MRRIVGIALDLLNPTVRQAFAYVLPTAQSKSIVEWVVRPLHEAEVVCCEPYQADSLASKLRKNQLRLWFAPRTVAEPYLVDGDISLDPAEVHVFNVLHALDMAALRFIDVSKYPRYADAFATTVMRSVDTAQPDQRAASTNTNLLTDRGARFSLTRWVQLTGLYRKRQYLHATAMMARRAVTLDEMMTGADIEREDALSLLRELRRIGALRQTVAQSAATPTAANQGLTPTPTGATRNHHAIAHRQQTRGIIGRVRAWLAGAA